MVKDSKMLFIRTVVGMVCIVALGILPCGGCSEPPPPKPAESKEERMEKEREMMHREMRNE